MQGWTFASAGSVVNTETSITMKKQLYQAHPARPRCFTSEVAPGERKEALMVFFGPELKFVDRERYGQTAAPPHPLA